MRFRARPGSGKMLGLVRGRIANTFADACGPRNIDHALFILPA